MSTSTGWLVVVLDVSHKIPPSRQEVFLVEALLFFNARVEKLRQTLRSQEEREALDRLAEKLRGKPQTLIRRWQNRLKEQSEYYAVEPHLDPFLRAFDHEGNVYPSRDVHGTGDWRPGLYHWHLPHNVQLPLHEGWFWNACRYSALNNPFDDVS